MSKKCSNGQKNVDVERVIIGLCIPSAHSATHRSCIKVSVCFSTPREKFACAIIPTSTFITTSKKACLSEDRFWEGFFKVSQQLIVILSVEFDNDHFTNFPKVEKGVERRVKVN